MQTHRLNVGRPRLTRSRRVQTCQQCRDSRIKCDRRKPSCGACITSDRACIYQDSLQSDSHDVSQTILASRKARSPHPNTTTKAIYEDRPSDNSADSTYRSRYVSDVSWLCALNLNQQDLPMRVSADSTTATTSSIIPRLGEGRFSPVHYDNLFSPQNTDALVDLYENHCHVWYPVVNPSEMRRALAACRDIDTRESASAALIAAICYIASKAARASGNDISSMLTCEEWQAIAQILLDLSDYPSKPSLHNIRAAFLLALGDVTETHSKVSVAPVSVLVRAAHVLGLHRDPSAYTSQSGNSESHRITWWAIYALEVCYSLVHGLPSMMRPGSFDTQLVSLDFAKQHPLFATIVRVNTTLCGIMENVYGIREPTRAALEVFEGEVDKICAEEAVPLLEPCHSTAPERFAVVSRRACCWKLKFVLHQPYLRSGSWPKNSRNKALDACKQYINDFLIGVYDPSLRGYRWIFDHFNVFHPCAIILRDLMQHAGSPEAQTLREIIDSCFARSFIETDPNWERLRVLRDQAWHANSWQSPSDEPLVPTNLSSWSFLCDPVFMAGNQN